VADLPVTPKKDEGGGEGAAQGGREDNIEEQVAVEPPDPPRCKELFSSSSRSEFHRSKLIRKVPTQNTLITPRRRRQSAAPSLERYLGDRRARVRRSHLHPGWHL